MMLLLLDTCARPTGRIDVVACDIFFDPECGLGHKGQVGRFCRVLALGPDLCRYFERVDLRVAASLTVGAGIG